MNFEMAIEYKFKNRSSKRLIQIILLLQVLMGSAAVAEQQSLEYKSAVILDISKSMEVNSSLILNLLSVPRFDDDVAKSITLVTYSPSSEPMFFNFVNSSEFATTLSSLKFEKGSTDFKEVLTNLEIWSREYSAYKREVIWITDSGGFKNANDLDETNLRNLELVADLEDWKIIQFSELEKATILSKVITEYIQLQQDDNIIPLEFSASKFSTQTAQTSDSILSDSGQNFKINIQPTLFIISLLSFVFALAFLRFLSSLLWKRKNSLTRRKLVEKLVLNESKVVAKDENKIWNSTPKFFRKHIDEFADSRGFSPDTKLKMLVWTSLCVFVLYFILFSSFLVSFIGTIVSLRFVFSRVGKMLSSSDEKKFSKEFPGFLSLLSGGLKSGLSLDQSIDAYCTQAQGIIARDFNRVLSEVRMGSSIDMALNELSLRRRDDDLTWLVTAISIQKEVGGSLSSIIDTVLETINGRSEVRREVKALSAEGKLSAYVLIALPISIFFYLTLTNREYIQVLWEEPLGIGILVVLTILIMIGWVWMNKIVNVKV